jgi:hydrogenase-4 membrane subunit HyfE
MSSQKKKKKKTWLHITHIEKEKRYGYAIVYIDYLFVLLFWQMISSIFILYLVTLDIYLSLFIANHSLISACASVYICITYRFYYDFIVYNIHSIYIHTIFINSIIEKEITKKKTSERECVCMILHSSVESEV